ncbi:MafI family immunity protein [Kribbella sp. NPDC048928]|uniref:MafI family immunity protein n=1 Tax=Kribbella sp. NPDC048928 TaxID=3364111 RepID=UPI0037208486
MNQDELNFQLRAVVLELQRHIRTAGVEDILDYVDHNEAGMAFEMLCSQLDEYDVELSSHLVERIAELGSVMSLPARKWKVLRVANG